VPNLFAAVLLKSFDIPEFFRQPEYSKLNFLKLSLLKNEFRFAMRSILKMGDRNRYV